MNGPIGELLKTPDFLRLWLVGAFANAMRWLELLASGLFAYEVTGSALAATAVVAARQLPQLLLGAVVRHCWKKEMPPEAFPPRMVSRGELLEAPT